jgi:hypothetical protein
MIDVVEPHEDAERVRQTDRWPRRPWLPMKRWRTATDVLTGFVFEDDVRDHRSVRLFASSAAAERALTEQRPPDGQLAVVETYESLQALLDDGWTAD